MRAFFDIPALRRVYVFAHANQRAAWLLAILLFGYTLWGAYAKEPYLSYSGVPFPTLVSSVRAGETIPIQVSRCNASNVEQIYSIARSLERVKDGRQFPMPDSIVRIKPGCHSEPSYANTIPTDVPPDRYRILGLSQIQTDFRLHYVSWSSGDFEVTSNAPNDR